MVTNDPRISAAVNTGRRPAWRLGVVRAVIAIVGGVAVFASFPPTTLWWLAPIGFAALGWVLYGRRARAGFGYGLLWGLGFTVPSLRWTGEYVGLVAWLPLSLICAVLIAVGTAAMAVVSTTRGAPLWMAALWVADEALRARFPFGGFPWIKIGFGQPEGWYLPVASIGGAPLLGFVVALSGFGLGQLFRRDRAGQWLGQRWRSGLVWAVAPLLVALALTPAVRAVAQSSDGAVTVAAIQGNVPRAGLDFNAQRRAVLDNHVAETIRLADEVRAGRQQQPDVVVWPENSVDIDPFRNADAAAQIDRAAQAIDAPILVGAVVIDAQDGLPRNMVILWDPQQGPTATYTKRQLQPFGETMPYRSFFRLFTPMVDRAGDFQPGHDPKGFSIDAAKIAVNTCYEVSFDWAVRDSVLAGSNMIAIPTNNATFGHTDMTYQQLAMSRVRAVEHGRSVVVAATSGVSAIVSPDGSVSARTQLFVPAAVVATITLHEGRTLATTLGSLPEWLLTGLAGVALVGIAVRTRRSRVGDTQ